MKRKELFKSYEKRKNQGYNYRFNILKNSLSPYLYSFNHIKKFLNKLEVPVTEMYDSVKVVKNYCNFTVDKDDMRV